MTVASRRCPACGMFISRSHGCDHMMCGTAAHGSIDDALQKGGCGHRFMLSNLQPTGETPAYGSPGDPHNERQVRFGKYTGPPIVAKYDKANQLTGLGYHEALQKEEVRQKEEAKAAKEALRRPPPKQGSTFSGASVAVRR